MNISHPCVVADASLLPAAFVETALGKAPELFKSFPTGDLRGFPQGRRSPFRLSGDRACPALVHDRYADPGGLTGHSVDFETIVVPDKGLPEGIGFFESFNGTLQDELLSREWLRSRA